MNEYYIAIMFAISFLAFLRFTIIEECDGLAAIGFGVAFILLLFSFLLPFGDMEVEEMAATNTQVGDELIIQVDGWPTQVENKISLLDKEVSVEKATLRNAWGGRYGTVYSVKLTEPVEKEKDEQN